MRQILFFTIAVFSLLLTSCSNDTSDYRYAGLEELVVNAHKEYYSYPGTSIKSSKKEYVITRKNGYQYHAGTIEGFDDIYKEGTEYRILVAVFDPNKLMPDFVDNHFKFIMILEEKPNKKYDNKN